MFLSKRLYRKGATLSKVFALRKMTTTMCLYKPIATAVDVPANKIPDHLKLTEQMTAEIQKKFDDYNKWAIAEYDMMISNRLANIIDSGNVKDWELAPDNSYLRKTFDFPTPDHAHYFVNEISKFCTTSDHHPEWSMIGNKSIKVNLTSHFAGNKVSLKDYELAQHMNKIHGSAKSHNPYSFITHERMIELGVFGLLLVSIIFYRWKNTKFIPLPKEGFVSPNYKIDMPLDHDLTEEDMQKLSLSMVTGRYI